MLKIYNSVLKESPMDSPFAPNMKFGSNNIWGDIVSGVGSVIGSIIGGVSTQQAQQGANETNLQISRETNAANERLYQTAIAQNERMWNLQNEYNSPEKQIERLKKANVNPATAFGNMNQVGAAGQVTAPNAPQMTGATVEPETGLGNAISGAFQGAVNAFNQSRLATAAIEKNEQETHGIQLDNEEKQRGMQDRLEYLRKMASREGYLGDLARTQLDFELKSFNLRQAILGADYTMQLKQINNAQEQFNQARLQNDLYKIQIAYAPKLNDAQLKQYYETVNQIKAQIGLINANKLLTDEQRAHEIVKKCGTIIQNGLTGLDFKLKEATQDFVKQQAHLTTERMKMENSKFGRTFKVGSLEFSPRADYEVSGKQWWPF